MATSWLTFIHIEKKTSEILKDLHMLSYGNIFYNRQTSVLCASEDLSRPATINITYIFIPW